MADINELMWRMAAQMSSGTNAGPEARRAGATVPGAFKSNTPQNNVSELMKLMAMDLASGRNAGPEARRAGVDVPGAYNSNTQQRLRPELLRALLAGSRGPHVDPLAGAERPPSFRTEQRVANRPDYWHDNYEGQVGKFDSAQAEAMAGRIMDDDSTYETGKYGKIVNKQAPTTPHPVDSGITPNLQDRLSNNNGPQTRNVAGWFGVEVVDYEDGTRRRRCLRPDLGCEVGTEVGEWY